MMRFIPLILRPKALSLKNMLRRERQGARDLILLAGSVLIIVVLYHGTSWSLGRFEQSFELIYVPPAVLLSIVYLALFGFLVISCAVSALGALYLNSNLELILASSIPRSRFFLGKIYEVAFESSWLILVLFAPFAAAFGRFYEKGFTFYALTAVVTVCSVLLASAAGVILVTLFGLLVPASRAREAFIIACGLVLGGLLYFISRVRLGRAEVEQVMVEGDKLISLIFMPSKLWSPTFWAGSALGEVLQSTGRGAGIYLGLLVSVTVALLASSYLVLVFGYQRAYTLSKSLAVRSRSGLSSRRYSLPVISLPVQALIRKEFRVFYRDTSYAFQVMMVLVTAAGYLFAMRFLNSSEIIVPGVSQAHWLGFLALFNAAIEALLINTICLRFVFPAVSLEGQSLWVLQASPMATSRFLRAKFLIWYLPVAVVSSGLFTLGGLSFGTTGAVLLLKGAATWIIVYGMIGLAIGTGSRYANFSWDHTSQLAAGFGNLMFMMMSVLLITVDLVLVWVPLYIVSLHAGRFGALNMVLFGASLVLLAGINLLIGSGALAIGERSLKAKLSAL